MWSLCTASGEARVVCLSLTCSRSLLLVIVDFGHCLLSKTTTLPDRSLIDCVRGQRCGHVLRVLYLCKCLSRARAVANGNRVAGDAHVTAGSGTLPYCVLTDDCASIRDVKSWATIRLRVP